MFWLDSMKDFKLYNNKTFLYPLADKQKKFIDNIIFLDTLNVDESIKIINHDLISNKYTKCYYINKTFYSTIRNIKKKKIVNQTNIYKKVKGSCKEIIKTHLTLDQYNNMSVYYDMSGYNELFVENAVLSPKLKIKAYNSFLNEIFDNKDIDNYKNKFFIHTIGSNDYKDFSDLKDKYDNILSYLYNDIYLKPENITNYPDMVVIIIGETSNRFFKFNLHSLNKSKLAIYKRLLSIMIKLENGEVLTEAEIKEDESTLLNDKDLEVEDLSTDKEIAKTMIKEEIKPKTNQEKEIITKVDEIIDSNPDTSSLEDLENSLNNDEEFLQFLDDLKQEKITAEKASKNSARNELLKEEQKKIKVNNKSSNKTLEEILNETNDKVLVKEELPIKGINQEYLKESSLRDFEKSYNEHLDEKDKALILNNFSADNREIKLYVRSIKVEDTSTAFTKKETYTIEFEDDRRVRHTVKVDFPVFLNDKFMYIEGNKKILNKQLVLLPIIKIRPDEVQITTNHNKTFVTRFGSKLSPKTERFKKLLAEGSPVFDYRNGDSLHSNSDYLTNIEYDEISTEYMYIKVKNNIIYFNQNEVREEFANRGFKIPEDKTIVPLGIVNDKPVLYDMNNNILYEDNIKREIDIIDYIIELISEKDKNIESRFNSLTAPKKYTYTRCNILNRKIPLLIFLAYNEGLSTILNKAGIKYELLDTRKVLKDEQKNRTGVIAFKNKYLYYDIYPLKNSLLLNSLLEVDTASYDYELFDSKEVYLELFNDLFGSRTIAKGFDNFYESFIDGITKEVLEDLNFPTDITGVMLYANELLQDNQYVLENDLSNYRIRSNEMVNAYFSYELEKAYQTYKNSINGATPIKISIPQDAILKDLTSGNMLQDYNTLNPITEADSISTVSYKGPGGLVNAIRFSSPL